MANIPIQSSNLRLLSNANSVLDQVLALLKNLPGFENTFSVLTVTGTLTAPVGGDLSGSLPNPIVSGIRNIPVSNTTPTLGQILAFNGTSWTPTNGTGESAIVVYKPGIPSAGNHYETAAEIATLLTAYNGALIIYLDNSAIGFANITIPSGVTWNCHNIAQIIGGSYYPTLEVLDGGIILNAFLFQNLVLQCDDVTVSALQYDSLTWSWGPDIIFDIVTIQQGPSAAVPMIVVPTTNDLYLQLNFSSFAASAQPYIHLTTVGETSVRFFIQFNSPDISTWPTNLISGDSTTNYEWFADASGFPIPTWTGFTGALIHLQVIDKAPGVAYSPAVPGNWTSPPTQVAQALDELAASSAGGGPTIKFDTANSYTTHGTMTVAPAVASTGSANALVLNNTQTLTSGDAILNIENNGTTVATFNPAGTLTLGPASGLAPNSTLIFNTGSSFHPICTIQSDGSEFISTIPSGYYYIWGFTGAASEQMLLDDGAEGALSLNVPLRAGAGGGATIAQETLYLQGNTSNTATAGAAVILDNYNETITSGQLISFRSNSNELASLDWQGNFNLGTTGGTVTHTPTMYFNAALSGTANQSSIIGVAAGGLTFNTPANAFQFLIASANGLTINATSLALQGTVAEVVVQGATTLTLQGNASSTQTGVIINSGTSTLTSGGGTVVSFRNNGVVTNSFGYSGNIDIGVSGGTATLTPSIFFNAASSGIAHQCTIIANSAGFLTYNAAATAHTFEIGSTVYLSLTSTQLKLENGVTGVYQTDAGVGMTLQGSAAATGNGVILNSGTTTLTSGGNIALFQNNTTQMASIDYSGQVLCPQISTNGLNPVTSVTGSTGFTSPSIFTNSTALAGIVTFTGVSHTYSAGDTLFVINWPINFPNNSHCIVSPANLATAALFSGPIFTSTASPDVVVGAGTGITTVAGSNIYSFNWICVGS